MTAFKHPGRREALAGLLLFTAARAANAQGADAPAGKTLTIAVGSDANTFDPHNTATINADLSVLSHVYTSLVQRDANLKLQPALATSWQAVDPRTWRFTLRGGVTFANGEALDAAAVKANFERVRDPKVNARLRPWFELVTSENVISPTELEVVTSAPYPALPDQLSMFFMLPPKWLTSANPATTTMPSGPYEITGFRRGDRLTLTARAGYAGEKPAFDTVVFRTIPEISSRIAALLAGEVDLITGIPPSELARIAASGRAESGSVDSIRSFFVKFNNLAPPFKDNAKLRLALNYAVDKQGIVDSLLGGLGKVSSCQILTPDYYGFNPDLKPIPYDPDRARALLREAGVTTPLTVDFDVPNGVYLLSEEITQTVAAQLADVGVTANIHEMDFGTFMNKYLRSHTMAPMAYLSLAWPTLDADGLLSFLESGNIYAYWDDAEFTQLLRDSRQATDAETRKNLLQRAAARACEQAPILFLFTQPATYGVSRRVMWHARGDDWVRAADFTPR
jgi:peptide/nickel transport system substrate-binding protein